MKSETGNISKLKVYACIVMNERTGRGFPENIKAFSEADARELCREKHPDLKILSVTKLWDCKS